MSPSSMPIPSPIALQHSDALRALINAEINQLGQIPFDRFMELALYAPGFGYYVSGSMKLGAAGDFVTAPEISPLFAQCLGNQSLQILSALPQGEILELGAGTGALAGALIGHLMAYNALPRHYKILEISPDLSERQRQYLHERYPSLIEMGMIQWLDQLPSNFEGVIIANEVVDAMPVQVFRLQHGIQEAYVINREGQWHWHFDQPRPSVTQAVTHILEELPDLEACMHDREGVPYQSEINLTASAWLQSMAHCLQVGALLIIDYGFPRNEYYHVDRCQGTLMCHYRHFAHADPFLYPGLQDITAHVDFTALAETAITHGLQVAGFIDQAHFLINCGLVDLLASGTDAEQFQQAQAVKKLTLPHEMGEIFKVLALTKQWDEPLVGFASGNRVGRL